MKYIIDVYGRVLLSGIAVAMLLLLLLFGIQDSAGNRGIFQMIGANLKIEEKDYREYSDFEFYRNECEKELPRIAYEQDGMLYAGEEIPVTDFIKASDGEGNPLGLRVLKVKYASGRDMTECFHGDSGSIMFPEAGIFQFIVAAKDVSGKKYTCEISVPVNGR